MHNGMYGQRLRRLASSALYLIVLLSGVFFLFDSGWTLFLKLNHAEELYRHPLTTSPTTDYNLQEGSTISPQHVGEEFDSHKRSIGPNDLLCAKLPKTLLGQINVDILELYADELSYSEAGRIQDGGSWKPADCIAREKVAVIVPYRERPKQLKVFLTHMHRILQRQKRNYRIFISEQAGSEKFNKGAVYNIGFKETLKYDSYDCYIFHDIDLLSLNDHNLYTCVQSPMQMSVVIHSPTYITGGSSFGGIQAIKKGHYISLNGYSNGFWGWGGEDDNMAKRVKLKQFVINRPSKTIGKYFKNMKNHYRIGGVSEENVRKARKGVKDVTADGLTTVKYLKFSKKTKLDPLYTLFSIDLQR